MLHFEIENRQHKEMSAIPNSTNISKIYIKQILVYLLILNYSEAIEIKTLHQGRLQEAFFNVIWSWILKTEWQLLT